MSKLHKNCIKVDIYTRGNNLVPSRFITTTDSVMEAAKICGLTPEMVSMCLHNRRKSGTFRFKFHEDDNEQN